MSNLQQHAMSASEPRSSLPPTAPIGAGIILPGRRLDFPALDPLPLDCGASLGPFTIAYQTYGTLNADKSNAILVCHALTGDQFVAGPHPVTGRRGWWDNMVGPGRPLDTDRYFLICSNILGGCMGTAGPTEINPAT